MKMKVGISVVTQANDIDGIPVDGREFSDVMSILADAVDAINSTLGDKSWTPGDQHLEIEFGQPWTGNFEWIIRAACTEQEPF